MSGNNIPGATVPLVGQDGRLSPAWFQFFVTLFARTGGTADLTEAEAVALPRARAGTTGQLLDTVPRRARAGTAGQPPETVPRRARRERRPDEYAPARHVASHLVLTKETYKPFTLIRLYMGAAGDIPVGWQLADGTNGTPNMHDLFVVGAGNLYVQGATGGSTTITANNLPAHTHPYNDANTTYAANTVAVQSGAGTTVVQSITAGGGDTARTSGNNTTTGQGFVPPYYAVAYIINTRAVTVVTDAKLR